MEDFENRENGTLSGFDAVSNEENGQNGQNGYTVTPEGGYYSRSHQDIIQDESAPAPAAESEPKRDYFPNGQYGYTNYGTQPAQNSFYTAPPAPKKPKKHSKISAGTVILASLLAAVIGAASGAAAVSFLPKTESPAQSVNDPGVPTQNVNINIDETAESVVEAVAKKVTPSVVGIRTTTSVMSFFGGSSESTGEGSGVVYTADGYIITNYHVISGAITNKSASKIEVFIDSLDSKSYEATVVGYNIASDLAVIKIAASGLTPAEIGDSSALKVGQYVITVGNPGGLEFMDSVTYGVISGLNRVVSSSSSVSLIQTDAAINPGNSGGALVNVKGQLVGINSSKIVSEEFEGMGFAIPSNTVVSICKNIISKENSPEPYIGITVSEKYTSSVLTYYGYPTGAVVLSVADGSPAETAGLRKGDIITEFNGNEIKEYNMLEDYLKMCDPGDKVSIKIYRSGRYYTATVTVASNNAVN